MRTRGGLFFSEHGYFEQQGERFVFRPSALASGFDVSANEKERLLEELPQIAKRSAFETIAFSIFAAVSLFYEASSGQAIGSANVWFIFIGLACVGFLGVYRRDRLVSQILPGRLPSIPRKTLAIVIAESNPFAGARATVSSLWLMRSLYVLVLALFDAAMLGLVLYSVVRTWYFGALSGQETFISLTDSAVFGGAVICFNAVLGAIIVALTVKIREARARKNGEGAVSPTDAIDVAAMRRSYPGP